MKCHLSPTHHHHPPALFLHSISLSDMLFSTFPHQNPLRFRPPPSPCLFDDILQRFTPFYLYTLLVLSTCHFIVWNSSDPKDKFSFDDFVMDNKVLYCIVFPLVNLSLTSRRLCGKACPNDANLTEWSATTCGSAHGSVIVILVRGLGQLSTPIFNILSNYRPSIRDPPSLSVSLPRLTPSLPRPVKFEG